MADPPSEPASEPDPPPFAPFARLSSEPLYSSRWCGLRRDRIRLPDGSLGEYHVVEISDAVVVVPFLPGGELALIWQYRYPHGKSHWEVPAGRIAAGESAAVAAERELAEEAGLAAGRLVELPGFYPINGISDHFAHAFAAHDCRPLAAARRESSEQILVRHVARPTVERWLAAGRFADGFSALALHYALSAGAARNRRGR
jgi:ADP-ribose pyrophosphatase